MTVAEIIDTLQQRYKPTDELYIEWWDRELVAWSVDVPVDALAWSAIVEAMDENGWDHSVVADAFQRVARTAHQGAMSA